MATSRERLAEWCKQADILLASREKYVELPEPVSRPIPEMNPILLGTVLHQRGHSRATLIAAHKEHISDDR